VKGRSEEAEKSTALDLLSIGTTGADGLLGGLLILASGNSPSSNSPSYRYFLVSTSIG
jgi:hypothetical protein